MYASRKLIKRSSTFFDTQQSAVWFFILCLYYFIILEILTGITINEGNMYNIYRNKGEHDQF